MAQSTRTQISLYSCRSQAVPVRAWENLCGNLSSARTESHERVQCTTPLDCSKTPISAASTPAGWEQGANRAAETSCSHSSKNVGEKSCRKQATGKEITAFRMPITPNNLSLAHSWAGSTSHRCSRQHRAPSQPVCPRHCGDTEVNVPSQS